MKKLKFSLLALSAMAVMFLSACGNDDDDNAAAPTLTAVLEYNVTVGDPNTTGATYRFTYDKSTLYKSTLIEIFQEGVGTPQQSRRDGVLSTSFPTAGDYTVRLTVFSEEGQQGDTATDEIEFVITE